MAFKEAENRPYEMMAKLLLNSLYGKFGQQIEIYDKVGFDESKPDSAWSEWDIVCQTMRKYRCLAGTIEEVVGKEEGYNSFPAIAAHVTAYARMYLWSLIEQAGFDNVFYVDTDSLIVNTDGFKALSEYIDAERLGALKLESKSRNLEVRNVKDYTFSTRSKTKGISLHDNKIKDGLYGQWQFIKLPGVMRNPTVTGCTQRYIEKHISKDYHKGIVLPDGQVKPYTLVNGAL